MKVLLVMNKPNREAYIMGLIEKAIFSMNPHAKIVIMQRHARGFYASIFKLRPNVILTFPFSSIGVSTWFYLFKILFRAKIISFRAEGVLDLSSEYNIQWATGFDKYGKYLVDYEIFWGHITAEVIGKNLVKQHKLSSIARVLYIGYPRLESYFEHDAALQPELPSRISRKIKEYARNKTILFASGFHLANYSKQDLFNAKDLDAENKLDELLEGVELSKQFRQAWIDNIIRISLEYPNYLFIFKKHPIELKENYEIFNNYPNILFVHEDVGIHDIMKFVGLFFHYGSTSLVDSYLSKVPSIYIFSERNKSWYTDLGWPSTRRASVEKMPDIMREYVNGKIIFAMTREIRAVLKEVFNIEEGKPYTPSKEIAEIILKDEPAQKIPWTDKYLWKSLALIFYQTTRRVAARSLKKLLGLNPDVPLRKNRATACNTRN